jgi:RimJ/RimL family protein N-acetyltransferase
MQDGAGVFLTTERLRLRRFTEDDVDLLVDLDSDPEVMHYITGGRTTSRQEIIDDYLPAFLGYYTRYAGFGFWATEERATDRFIGWFHLRPPNPDVPLDVELGYRLRRDTWGLGYAVEGSRALIDKAFADFGAHRVNAETMAVHVASRRVMERSGLRYVRTFFQPWPDAIPGNEQGDVEYALTRAEWAAGQLP